MMYGYETERKLMEDMKYGNSNAIEYFYRNNFHIVYTLITKNSGTMEDAKDVMQMSILAMLRNFKNVKFELTARTSTYFYSIARNIWMQELRNRNRQKEVEMTGLELGDEIELPDTFHWETEEDDQADMVAKEMENLTKDCRELLVDYYYKEMSFKVLAQKYETTEKYIKTKMARCRGYLRKAIEKKESLR